MSKVLIGENDPFLGKKLEIRRLSTCAAPAPAINHTSRILEYSRTQRYENIQYGWDISKMRQQNQGEMKLMSSD